MRLTMNSTRRQWKNVSNVVSAAKWIDGQALLGYGAVVQEEDLAGLVCNNLGDDHDQPKW